MKLNKFILVAAPALVIGALAACAPTATSSSVPTPSSSVDDATVLSNVISNLSGTFAVTGEFDDFWLVNNEDTKQIETWKNGSLFYTTAQCGSYFYMETSGVSYRYDKTPDGFVTVKGLDGTTNTIEDQVIEIPFDLAFGNPFIGTHSAFSVSRGNTITLDINNASFNQAAIGYILALGVNAPLDSLTIAYDSSFKPTTIEASWIEGDPVTEGFAQAYSYSGTFIDPSTLNIPEVPTVTPAQEGQALLEAAFATLREKNYTVNVTVYSGKSPMMAASATITPDEFIMDQTLLGGGISGAKNTEKGLAWFTYEDGQKVGNRPVLKNASVEGIVGEAWSYIGATFNVGTLDGGTAFTLPNATLSKDPAVFLLPDNLLLGGVMIDPGTLSITLGEGTLNYSYTMSAFGSPLTIKGVVSNIGTTLPMFNEAEFVPYTPITNWTEYLNKHGDPFSLNNLELITRNQVELLPCVEPPLSVFTESWTYQNSDDETWEVLDECGGVFTLIAECSDEEEAQDMQYDYLDQIDEIGGYHYDTERQGYVYTMDGVDTFMVQIAIVENYFDEMFGNVYPYVFVFEVENLAFPDWYEPWPEE